MFNVNKRAIVGAFLALMAGGALAVAVPASASSTHPAITSTSALGEDYHALPAPQRLLDTRSPNPVQTLPGLGSLTVQVAGQKGVPINATAVVMNVTVADTTSAGYVSVVPDGADPTSVSTVNFPAAGALLSNTATVALPDDGKVTVYNHQGNTDVVLDVLGYYTDAPAQVFPTVTTAQQVAATSTDANDPGGVVFPIGGSAVGAGTAQLTQTVTLQPGVYQVSVSDTLYRKPGTSVATDPDTYASVLLYTGSTVASGFSNVLFTQGGTLVPKMLTSTGDIDPTQQINTVITVGTAETVTVGVHGYDTDRSSTNTGNITALLQSANFVKIS